MRLTLGISRFGGGIGIPDTTPAEITNLTAGPQATGTGNVPASFDLSENASIRWVLVTNGSTAPSVPEVAALESAGGGSPADSGSFSAVKDSGVTQDIALASGLSGAYDLYMVALDGPQNLPAAVDSALNITIDTTAPTVTPTPADGATDVAVDADLVFTFSKSMKTTGTSATVTLKNVGGATIETFDPDVDGTWSTTTNANDTWTVTPASNFTNEASLAVQYSGFEDTFGNAVAAVSDDTTWNFDVVAASTTSFTHLSNHDWSGSTNTNTYSSVSIGAADAGREIYVAFAATGISSGDYYADCTIGGISASVVEEIPGPGGGLERIGLIQLFKATVPTGTTADIVITRRSVNSYSSGSRISVYRATGSPVVQAASIDGTASTTASVQVDLDVSQNVTAGNKLLVVTSGDCGSSTTVSYSFSGDTVAANGSPLWDAFAGSQFGLVDSATGGAPQSMTVSVTPSESSRRVQSAVFEVEM